MDYDFLKYLRDPNPWVPPRPLPGPITTERLIVRRWQRGDGPLLFEAVESDRASLLPWMVWARKDHRTVDESIHYVESQMRKVADPAWRDFNVGLFERESGRCVGGAGYARVDASQREAEIGYFVRGDARRRGYCTEAVRGMLTQGFTSTDQGGWGFRRIHIQCLSENAASRRVCEKLGLRQELQVKEAKYLADEHGGRYYDLLGYGILHDEWDCEHGSVR